MAESPEPEAQVLDNIHELFAHIEAALSSEPDPTLCWARVLAVAGQPSNVVLANANIESEIGLIAGQLRRVWAEEPPPDWVTFLYFGLFDAIDEIKGRPRIYAGFYVSGGKGDNYFQSLSDAEQPYFPKHCYLSSKVLDAIAEIHQELSGNSQWRLEYARMLGAAAILVRGVAKQLSITLPVFVGFDSGDYLRVIN